ncbi:SLC41A family transporter [Rothia mucilaginosa]|uniref:SLC41A family transporter n=1 Tax=Rothia mucilaginosa TaxID=43675 RepID=UPI00066D12DA|nr:magnesium transporter [Rothia mucilaginosa]
MAEHSEAPKNPQNPTEKSDSEYQPLWDMEQPAPDYSALLLHGTPVAAPTGEIPEPVKEVLAIQKARSASAPADTVTPALTAPSPAVPDSAAPALSVSAPAPSAQAANFFPSATGHPVLNRPLYGRPGPTMRRMSPMGTDTAASANQQAPSVFPTWQEGKVAGTPRPIGYISATALAGKVRVSDLWWKAWPEFIVLFFVGVVFNPLTYLLLATVTEDPSFGGFIFYFFLMLSLVTAGLPLFLWAGALIFVLLRVSRKYRALKWKAMPLGSFWFYLVYDRLPRDSEEMQGILGAASSMSSVASAPQPLSAPSPTSSPVPNSADAS